MWTSAECVSPASGDRGRVVPPPREWRGKTTLWRLYSGRVDFSVAMGSLCGRLREVTMRAAGCDGEGACGLAHRDDFARQRAITSKRARSSFVLWIWRGMPQLRPLPVYAAGTTEIGG